MVKRCAIYIRVSTAMQKLEGWSLEAQRDGLMAYASRQGWKVIDVYADEGKSARKRLKDRKEIHRLLADVKAGLVDIILFKELDRWFRNVSDFYKVQDVLDAHGVTWVSERQPSLRMDTKEGRMTVNVLLSVGQNESDATSERIKYTNRYLRTLHRWNGGPQTLPLGYTLDADRHVVIDESEEPYVRDLIAEFARTFSIRDAMHRTNEKHGHKLFYQNAIKFLHNPMLCGEYQGIIDFVEHPYMTREEFDEMQAHIRTNVRKHQAADYIFPRIVICARCGKNMSGNQHVKRSGSTYIYYKCRKAVTERNCGNNKSAAEKRIEQELLAMIRPALDAKIVEVQEITRQKAAVKRVSNRAQIERKLDKLEDLYISSDRMTRERYEEKKAAILAQLIDEAPAEDDGRLADLEAIRKLLEGPIEEAYASMDKIERRAFWRGVLSKITVDDGHVVSVDFL